MQQVTSPLAILPSPPPCVCTPPLSLRLHLIYLSPGLHRLPVSTPHPVRLRSRLISLPASLCSHLTLAASSLSLRFHSFSSIPGVPPPPHHHQIRRATVDDAMAQLCASPKRSAVFVKHAVANARNNAIVAGGDPARLFVAEAFVTKGKYMKRIHFMGRWVRRLGGLAKGCWGWWLQTGVLCVGTCGNAWEAGSSRESVRMCLPRAECVCLPRCALTYGASVQGLQQRQGDAVQPPQCAGAADGRAGSCGRHPAAPAPAGRAHHAAAAGPAGAHAAAAPCEDRWQQQQQW